MQLSQAGWIDVNYPPTYTPIYLIYASIQSPHTCQPTHLPI